MRKATLLFLLVALVPLSAFAQTYSLNIGVIGKGTTDPAPGLYTGYPAGAVVQIDAQPQVGHTLLAWLIDGVPSGTTDPLNLTITKNTVVQALFSSWFVTVAVSGSGFTAPVPGVYPVANGTNFSLQASPAGGWLFDHWDQDGANIGSTNPIQRTITADTTITAVFLQSRTLTVSATGQGTTSPVPGAYTYGDGATVPITATPDAGHEFISWTIDGVADASTDNPLDQLMDANHTVAAVFTDYIVTVNAATGGTTNPVAGSYAVQTGDTFSITATPDLGSLFVEWLVDGVSAGSTNPLVDNITADVTIEPVFSSAWTLTISAAGTGTTSPVPGAYTYSDGTNVTVTANPGPGRIIIFWIVDGTVIRGTDPVLDPTPLTVDVTMDADKSVFAQFSDYSVTITSGANGSLDVPDGTYQAQAGAQFGIEATPDPGFALSQWLVNGVDFGRTNPLELTVNEDLTIASVFVAGRTLTMSSSGNGSTFPSGGSYVYPVDDVVSITATPGVDHALASWIIDGVPTPPTNPLLLTMDVDHAVEAVFSSYLVNVLVIGDGVVDVPLGMNPVVAGESLTITPTANSGSSFVGWLIDGVPSGNTVPLVYTPSADATVQAVFDVDRELVLSASGNGTTNPAPGTSTYAVGTDVSITALPNPNHALLYWNVDGVPAGSANPLTVTMSTDRTVEAVFSLYLLTVAVTGNGTTSPAPGVTPVGAQQQITATPDPGWVFANWLVDGTPAGSNNPETFTLSADTTVTAVFVPERTLNLSSTGNGTTVPTAGTYTYGDGSSVSIAATADPTHELFYWLVNGVQIGRTPAVPDPPNPLELTMDEDKTVVAVFTNAFATLSVEGNGTITPIPPGTYPLPTGFSVDLTAQAETGWAFDHWELLGVTVSTEALYALTVTGDLTLTAVFVQEFNLTTAVSPLGTGTVTPDSGAFKNGTDVQLTAAPAAGYRFVEWQGDLTGTDNPATLTMNNDKSVTAVFEQVTYGLNVVVTPDGSGTVAPPNGAYASGQVLSLTATPATGYRFVEWQGDVTGTVNPVDVTMDADKAITAVFELQEYTFTASVSPVASGTVTPSSGTYTLGTVLDVTATPAANYQFVNWTGPVANPNSAATTVTINGDTTITANFQLITWTLSTTVSPVGGGTVNPANGTYTNGTPVQLTATPAAGYRFVEWTGDASGSTNPVTVTMNANKSVTAVFIQQVTLTTAVSPLGSGTVNPSGGTFDLGASVQLTATPVTNFEFVRWEVAGDGNSTANPLSLTMNANKTVTAVFQQSTFDLTTSVTPLGSGTVSPSSGTFNAGQSVQLTAIPLAGFEFVQWQGDASGSANPVTITMDANKSVTAQFAQITYDLTTEVSPAGTGSVTPFSGTYVVGTQLQLLAEAADQYMFDHWEGDADGSANPLDLTMDSDKHVIAVFVKEMFTLSTSVTPLGAGTVDPSGGSFEPGETVELTATPAAGFTFDGWTGDVTSSDNPVTVTMDSSKDVTAVFVPITYDLTTAVNPAGSGSVEPLGGTYNAGTVVELTATPETGYEFVEWTGDVTGTDNPISVTMDSDKSVTAVFELECQLTAVSIVTPVDGATIVVDEGAQGQGIAVSADTDCTVDTASVTFQLDDLEPVTVTTTDPSGFYSVVTPPVSEIGFGQHTVVATAASATQDGVTFTDTVIFTIQPPVTEPDQDGNGLPDYPFAALAGDGDSWTSSILIAATEELRTTGAVRWDARCEGKQGLSDPVVSVENPLDPTQVVTATAPADLLECGQSGILIVQVAADLATLYGPANAALFAADPSGLVDGSLRIEVSIIVTSNDADYAEISPSLLALNPAHITIEGLDLVEGGTPLLYAHPTNAFQDTSLGLQIAPLSGTWSGATVANTVVGDGSVDADLTGLSSLAVFQGPAIQLNPSSKYRYVYGFTELGTTKDAKFTVTNAGGTVMNGQASTAAPYSIVGSANYSLAPGQSAVVTVRFTPTQVGGVTGAVVFTGGLGTTVQVVGTGYELTGGCANAGTISSGTTARGSEGDVLMVALVLMVMMVTGKVAARKRA